MLGTRFSHHSLHPQFQPTRVYVASAADPAITRQLPPSWTHEDEWYVFFEQPQGVRVVSYINGEQIIPDGNLLWIKDKNFGMGKYHPVAWCRWVGKEDLLQVHGA